MTRSGAAGREAGPSGGSARIAGFTFLFYIAAGIASLLLFGRATAGIDIAAKLATLAHHVVELRFVVLLDLACSFSAMTLGVTLYALTWRQGEQLAMFALVCRLCEGFLIAGSVPNNLDLLWLANAAGGGGQDANSAQMLAAYLLRSNVALTSSFFAVGSLLFAVLFVRGRVVPAPLAWLGIAASGLLVIALPLQLAGFLDGAAASLLWLPMLAFEVPLGLWLLFKGVTTPTLGRAARFGGPEDVK
ncbi:MAG: DUF4386 domain-containing protein [Terricaulis sp.]